jgi:2-methylcitrate dehydratase PrpD
MTLLRGMARGVTEIARRGLDARVEREALRALLNVLGTTVSGMRSPDVPRILSLGRGDGASGTVSVPGLRRRTSAYLGALVIGFAAHVDDFDDTHLLSGNIHPGSVALGATLGLAEERGASGREFLTAFAVTCETLIRIGESLAPSHHAAGWQPSTTCGPPAAAFGAGLLLGLDEKALAVAAAIGGTRPLGHREGLGTPAKAYHVARACVNGLSSARLAERGVAADPGVWEAEGGAALVLAEAVDTRRALDGLGSDWRLLSNTYKAYPCGVVAHPGIDAALAAAQGIDAGRAVQGVVLECHPLVVELMDRAAPANGLEARFSSQHAVACAVARGRMTLEELTDEAVSDPEVARVRSLVTLVPRPDFDREQAAVAIHCSDGRRQHARVESPRGSARRPLTDAELGDKVMGLARPLLGDGARRIIEAVSGLVEQPTLGPLIDALTPAEGEPGCTTW